MDDRGLTQLLSDSVFGSRHIDLNFSFHGLGTLNAAIMVAALVFSPPESIIMIEESESHLHPSAQEVIVDLINKAVVDWGKQVIYTTHSRGMLNPYLSGFRIASARGEQHVMTPTNKFKLLTMALTENVEIQEYDLNIRPPYTRPPSTCLQYLVRSSHIEITS